MVFHRLLTRILVFALFFGLVSRTSLAVVQQMDEEGHAFFLAKSAYDDGFFPEASEQLKTILQKYPRTRFKTEIYFLRGQCALAKGDLERAAVHFRRVLRGKENLFQERALFYLGQTYYQSRKDKLVLESVQDLLAKYPLTGYAPVARLSVGKSLRRMGCWAEAQETFVKIGSDFEGKPAGGWAVLELVKMYEAKGRHDKAVQLLKGLAGSPGNPLRAGKLELWLAHCLSVLGEDKEALAWYDKALGKGVAPFLQEQALIGKARTLRIVGDREAATAAYESFIKTYPRSLWRGWAQLGLARLKLDAKDSEGATRILDGASEWVLGGRLREAAEFLKCQIALQKKDYAQAVGFYQKFLSHFPRSRWAEVARYEVALGLFYAGKYQESIAKLDRWLTAGQLPGLRRSALLLKGDALYRAGRLDEAILQYEEVLTQYAGDAEVLHRLGDCLYQKKRYRQADKVLERLLQEYPQSPWVESALYRLGWIKFHGADYSKSAEYFHSLGQRFPDGNYAEQALYQMGNCWHLLRNYEKALEAYQELLKKFPKGKMRERGLIETAWTFASAGRDKEATEVFGRFLKEYPSSAFAPGALFWLGQERMSRNDYRTAQGFFEKIYAPDAKCDLADDALFCAGIALARSGRHEESCEMFQKLLSGYPASDLRADALFMIADNEAAMKRYGKAIALLSEIVSGRENITKAPAAYARMADCHFAKGEYQKALAIYSKLAEGVTPPVDAAMQGQARFKKAICLEVLGQWEEAKIELMSLVYSQGVPSPWAARAALKLGEIFQREDRHAEALRLYRKLEGQPTEEREIARQRIERIKSINNYEKTGAVP